MATATLNPLLISVSGRIGSFVFYRRKNTQCIRTYVVPYNPDTALQRNIRSSFADAVKSWQSLTGEERYKYKRRSRRINMSGYNLYISEYLKNRMSASSKPKVKTSFQDLLYSSALQRQIHSVSASLCLLLCTLTALRELFNNRGNIAFFVPADS